MVTVKAGKFLMCLISYPIIGDKSVFKGITSVEGTLKDFKEINKRLKRYPVFPPFDISDMEVSK